MKKFINVLKGFSSVILTIILAILIFLYIFIYNIKILVSEEGLIKTLQKIDIVDALKYANKDVLYDLKELGDTFNLTDEKFNQIINSDKIKNQIGSYISDVIESSFSEKDAKLEKEDIDKFLNTLIDEYNIATGTNISSNKKQLIIELLDDKITENINEEFSSINLEEIVDKEYVKYIKLTDKILFGNYIIIMLITIAVICILLIILRLTNFKWISYIRASIVISGILSLITGIISSFIPQYISVIVLLKETFTTYFIISAIIHFAASTILSFIQSKLQKEE